jgi:adenylate cyclase
LGVLIPLLVLAAAIGLRLLDPPILVDLRHRVFDQYQTLQPRPYDPQWHSRMDLPGVAIIDIDEASLARHGQWPWPRDLIARLLGQSYAQGAVAVAFDMVFAEPDRASLDGVVPRLEGIAAYASLREEYARLKAQDASLTSNDRFLADTLQQLPTVVLGFSFSDHEGLPPRLKKGIVVAGSTPFGVVPTYSAATPNLAELESAASGIGSFNVLPDRDGVVRRVPLVFALGSNPEQASWYPSLVAEVLRVAQGDDQSLRLKMADGAGEVAVARGTAAVMAARIGEIDIPVNAEGEVLLWDSGPRAERYLPAWQVLDATIPADAIAGKILFVGTSAPGLLDLKATPVAALVPGVEVHAQIAEQILTQRFLQRPDFATGLELVFMAILGLILIVVIQRSHAGWGAVLALLAVAGAVIASWLAYSRLQWLYDPIYPALTILGVYLVGSLINFARNEADKKQIRTAFGRYLSPALVEQLARHPERLQLGGEQREMTLLFSDIRGFTTLSERFDPQCLTRFINGFLTPMTEVILAERGTIDKYIGDCIMAFWNAPLDVPDHAAAGCRAALRMFERLELLNAELAEQAKREERPFQPLQIGAGLNTGSVCVGNMGSELRFDYSVLGDTVNLAARLEGQSKYYGVDIVIGQHTEAAIRGQFATLELDLIRVKGKTIPVRIHALLGGPELLASTDFARRAGQHREMLAAFRSQRWADCEQLCRELQQALPKIHGLYDLYRERITEFRKLPPGDEWDGVYAATSK